MIEVKQREFSFAFLHDFQNCTSNDVDDAFTSSVPKKLFCSLEALKESCTLCYLAFTRKATYDQLIANLLENNPLRGAKDI